MTEFDELGLPAHAFDKQDAGKDLDFYAPARLVTHIDEAAVEALSAFYRARLPAGAHILDLMSSWVSHLPSDVSYAAVVGHGMMPTNWRPIRSSTVGPSATSMMTRPSPIPTAASMPCSSASASNISSGRWPCSGKCGGY